MADWPDADQVRQLLDVDLEVDNWGWRIDGILASAIYRVKQDVGVWDEFTDEPDDSLSQAAARMCELIAERPEAASGSNDPTYWRLLFGHRKRFAIS